MLPTAKEQVGNSKIQMYASERDTSVKLKCKVVPDEHVQATSCLAFRLAVDSLDLEELLLLLDVRLQSQRALDLVREQQHCGGIHHEGNSDETTGLGR